MARPKNFIHIFDMLYNENVIKGRQYKPLPVQPTEGTRLNNQTKKLRPRPNIENLVLCLKLIVPNENTHVGLNSVKLNGKDYN